MAKLEIKIQRDQNQFVIKKDANFNYLVETSLNFYNQILEELQKLSGNIGNIMKTNPKFISLIDKFVMSTKNVYLPEEDFVFFVNWVDCLCLIVLDIESVDYKNKEIKKFFTLSERFIKRSKELMVSQTQENE